LSTSDGAVDVLGSFRVEADDVGARFGEIRNDAVHRPHHQVYVDEQPGTRPQRSAHQRPDGQVGNVVIVHDIEVQQVGARRLDRRHLLAEPREIGRQDGRGDAIGGCGGHGPAILSRDLQ
jgi:hypothetical protein